MKIRIIRPGSFVKDRATNLSVMLTYAHIGPGGVIRNYGVQNKGINPDTQHPVPSRWINPAQLETDAKTAYKDIDVPIEVLGTKVTDKASGFTGNAIAFVIHLNGCIHVEIQAEGINKKTGGCIDVTDMDIRRLKGPKVPVMTVEEQDASERRDPSPGPAIPRPNRMP